MPLMNGHLILHMMDNSSNTSVLELRIKQSRLSVRFLEEIKRNWVLFRIQRAEKQANKGDFILYKCVIQAVSVVQGHKSGMNHLCM